MGRSPALFQRESRHVWWLLCWSYADVGGHRPPATSRGNLPGSDSEQLPRRVDLSRRRVRTMVQRVMDLGTRARYVQSQGATQHQRDERNLEAATLGLPALRSSCFRLRLDCHACSLLSRLAGSSQLRRLLEKMVNRRTFLGHTSAFTSYRRLVRHFSGWLAPQLPRNESARWYRRCEAWPATDRSHWRTCRIGPQDRRSGFRRGCGCEHRRSDSSLVRIFVQRRAE